jgi:DNA polymerase
LDTYRKIGKEAVLGLGFGMGSLKFMNRLLAEPGAARLFESGDLSASICRQIVEDYRRQYSRIRQFWQELEEAARVTIDGIATDVGGLRFDRVDDVVRIWLPSGRALRYASMRMENIPRTIRFLDKWGQEAEFTPDGLSIVYGNRTTLYGGKLCENIVQAIARDILVEAVLRLEDRGYHVLFHVHDEVVVEVEQARAMEAQSAVQDELSRVPAWSVGLPIASEVTTATKYQK